MSAGIEMIVCRSPTVAVRPGAVRLSLCLLAFAASPLLAAADTEHGSFDSDGVTIHYQIDGAGEPVLLIHGYSVSGDFNWRFPGVLGYLARSYRVITIDNRGHGKSDKPEEPAAYGRHMVEDQVRLLDHLGVETAHVVGYSMGGMITLRLLADHPERVRSAVIGGMGWTPADEETRRYYREGNFNDRRPPAPAHVAVRRSLAELGLTEEELRAIEVPMVIVIGDEDALLEHRVKPMLEVRPDVPLVVIEKTTHSVAAFRPAFHEAVREFLDEQQRRAEAP